MLGLHSLPQRRLAQRNPDGAAIGRKLHTCLNPLERDQHTFSIAQLHAPQATDPGAAAANGVVGTRKVLYVTQPRNAPRQSHHGGADRYTEAQAGNPKRIVAIAVRQDTASSAGA